jgi:hypothetical protein
MLALEHRHMRLDALLRQPGQDGLGHAGPAHDLHRAAAFGRGEDDPCPPDMLLDCSDRPERLPVAPFSITPLPRVAGGPVTTNSRVFRGEEEVLSIEFSSPGHPASPPIYRSGLPSSDQRVRR